MNNFACLKCYDPICNSLNIRTRIFFLYVQKSAEAGADEEDEIVEINLMSAVTFVITASGFLLLLYFFMSAWFVWVLIILFSIGGVQVCSLHLNTSNVTLPENYRDTR